MLLKPLRGCFSGFMHWWNMNSVSVKSKRFHVMASIQSETVEYSSVDNSFTELQTSVHCNTGHKYKKNVGGTDSRINTHSESVLSPRGDKMVTKQLVILLVKNEYLYSYSIRFLSKADFFPPIVEFHYLIMEHLVY